jgi:outer membrane phospholipase A
LENWIRLAKARGAGVKILFSGLALLAWPSSSPAEDGLPHPIAVEAFKPGYALYGNPFTKIQMSFQSKLIDGSQIYFGYTQLMMWDLGAPAPYFFDVNYNPMLWYRVPLSAEKAEWIDLIPEEHESNGKGFSRERSWDRIGAAYHRRLDFSGETKLFFHFKTWYPWHINSIDNDPTDNNPGNSDISEYRGSWEVTFALSNFLGSSVGFNDLILRLYPGGPSTTDPSMGGQELTFRIRSFHKSFLPLFVVQIFHGYAEDLLLYRTEQFQVRAGLGF